VKHAICEALRVHLQQIKRRMRRQAPNDLNPSVQRNERDMNRIVSQVLDYLIFTVLLLSGAAFLMALTKLL
jgi:hypothetical protein